jgi:collagenase-like PrtC family protease
MKQAIISTFISSKEHLHTAYNAGARHFILEDSKVSIRSFSDDFSTPTFSKLIDLAKEARSLDSTLSLCANCDLLVHERHYPILETFVAALREAGINQVRIQDQGLIPYFTSVMPDIELHYAQETGNHNTTSAAYYAKFCAHQSLSSELTYAEIAHYTPLNCTFDIQVQGPLMIQYSNRRFMAGKTEDEDNDTPSTKYAHDKDYPGREFIFHDNPHGHFMYVYFDRSLLRYIPQLCDLELDHWLIDARGESLDYLDTTIKAYITEQTRYLDNKDSWAPDLKLIDAVRSVAQRDQKPGFFRANQTDRGRKAPYADVPEDAELIGRLIDVIRERWVTVECETPFKVGDDIYISTPRKKLISTTIKKMRDLNMETITESGSQKFVQIPWVKGMLSKSRLFHSSSQL